jgi:hypothetical protein
MATMMTIAQFRQQIMDMAQARSGLKAYCAYLRHDTREDKYLREEHLPILAVIDYKAIPDTEQIELGNEKEPWDARVSGQDLYEVVQALPLGEHQVRREIAGAGQSPVTYLIHAADHVQFPEVIVDVIEKKHKKGYMDGRSLVVVFGGDYSGEEDGVVHEWVRHVRGRTTRGTFAEVLLVELDRRKVFPLFAADGRQDV